MQRGVLDVLKAVLGTALWAAMVALYAWLRTRVNGGDWLGPSLWSLAGVVGSSAIWIYARARGHGYENVADKSTEVQSELSTLAEDLRRLWGDSGMHVRACVMLPNRVRTKRKVLFTCNFESADRDADLELDIQSGLSGLAWFYGQPRSEGDLKKLHKQIIQGKQDKTTFLLRREEALRVRPSIDSMMAVRIENPRKTDTPIGCLCVDSDKSLEDTRFGETEVRAIVDAHARTIARILVR
jgi:hypothetical protein